MLAKLVLFAGMAIPLLLTAQQLTPEMASHAQLAQEAERHNDFSTAVREYRRLAGMLPNSAEIQSNLGVALYFDHQLRPAIAAFHKAMAINPSLMAPHLFSGLAWYQLSNPDSAVPELEKAIRINAKDPNAHIWLGYAYSAQGHSQAAVRQFEEASRIDANNIDVWYALGHTWLDAGKDATLTLLAVAPDGGRVWELAGDQSQMRGDQKAALYDFEQAEQRRPDLLELRQRIAALGGTTAGRTRTVPSARAPEEKQKEDAAYEQAHNAEEQSRAAFERVVQLAPDSYRAHQIMADAYVSQKQDRKAIDEYRKVVELKPDLSGVHDALGEALLRTGDMAGALQEFEAEIKIQPQSAKAYMDAGRALRMLGRDAESEKMLDAAATMNRPPLETYVLLGQLKLGHKNYHAAIAALTRYTAKEKGNSTAYYLLAMAYRGLGDQERMKDALAMYKKTSMDAKARTQAEKQLRPAEPGTDIAEKGPDGQKFPSQ